MPVPPLTVSLPMSPPDRVGARVAEEGIVPDAAVQDVIAIPAVKEVVGILAAQRVVAGLAEQTVAAQPAPDLVVARPTVKRIVSAITVNEVRTGCAVPGVGIVGARDCCHDALQPTLDCYIGHCMGAPRVGVGASERRPEGIPTRRPEPVHGACSVQLLSKARKNPVP